MQEVFRVRQPLSSGMTLFLHCRPALLFPSGFSAHKPGISQLEDISQTGSLLLELLQHCFPDSRKNPTRSVKSSSVVLVGSE